MQLRITDDLGALLATLPPRLRAALEENEELSDLLEVVLDLGRLPSARFPGHEIRLGTEEVSHADLEYVVARIGHFGDDNRAGIERTLHRISAFRSRSGRVVGLTCRVGRAVYGTINIIEDLVRSDKSLLLLGRPGVGKTTVLREVARVLADDARKRVIIVDTSNEIAGDGDIPHSAIGSARRMQVRSPNLQHAVMIEAVENHMPEVIVIDEIGTELEAVAARTIAERGVQLVGTAHGNTLDNLVLNPTLSDLIGGIQAVTLGDEEARRRGTQKTVLERKAPPTFDIIVEIQGFDRVAVHDNVAETVDALLRGRRMAPELRWRDEEGNVHREAGKAAAMPSRGTIARGRGERAEPSEGSQDHALRLMSFGVHRNGLERAAHELHIPIAIVESLQDAEVLVTSRAFYRRKPPIIRSAEGAGVPVYVVKSSALPQLEQFLMTFRGAGSVDPVQQALHETEVVIQRVLEQDSALELAPQNAYVRRLQHQLAEEYQLYSFSRGREPYRSVIIQRTRPQEESDDP